MKKSGILVLLVIIILTLPAYRALLKPGLITGHDIEDHLVRLIEFDRALNDGQFPIRWAGRINFGLGYPFFVFNYPLTYYLTEIVHRFGLTFIDSIKFVLLISFPLSALFAYLWLRNHFSQLSAAVGGLFYTLIPYHFLNVYVRGALGEVVGMTLIPLNFYLIDRVLNYPSPRNCFLLALGLTMAITTHNITALIYAPLWFIYGLIIYLQNPKLSQIVTMILGFISAVLLSAFFLIPALGYKSLTYLDQIMRSSYQLHFPAFQDLVYSPWGYLTARSSVEQGGMSFQIGVIHEVLIVLATMLVGYLLVKKVRIQNSHLVLYFLGLLLLALILTQEVTQPIWDRVVPLQYIQFPWRLLSVVAVASTFLIAFQADWFNRQGLRVGWKVLIITLVIGLLLYSVRNIARPNQYRTWFDPLDKSGAYSKTTTAVSEHRPLWHQPSEESLPYAPYRVESGVARVVSINRLSNYHTFRIIVTEKAVISDRTEYFPGWKVLANGRGLHLLDPQDVNSKGLLTFELTPGEYFVESTLVESPLERFSNTLSILTFIVFLGLVFRFPKYKLSRN